MDLYLKPNEQPDFDAVYKKFRLPLFKFARKFINNEWVAEEIVNDAFLKYWKKQAFFTKVENVYAFLLICVKHSCINYLMQEKRSLKWKNAFFVFSEKSSLESVDEVKYEKMRSIATALLQSLPTKCREVMIRHYVDGLDLHEIAKEMKITIHTVRRQRENGIRKIIKALTNDAKNLK